MDERIKQIESLFLKPNELDGQTIEQVKQRDEVERILCGEPMSANDVEILFVSLQGVALDNMHHLQRAVFQHGDDAFNLQYKKHNSGKSFAEGAREHLGSSGFEDIQLGMVKIKEQAHKDGKSKESIRGVKLRSDRVAQSGLKEKIKNEWKEARGNYSGKSGFVRANIKRWQENYPEDVDFPLEDTIKRWIKT